MNSTTTTAAPSPKRSVLLAEFTASGGKLMNQEETQPAKTILSNTTVSAHTMLSNLDIFTLLTLGRIPLSILTH